VITDVNMPDINGLELIKFCRTHPSYAATPVIIISTEGRDRDRDRGMSLGANAYLVKPFSPQSLLDVVGAWSGRRAPGA
jgi:two-component system chemotaxis response regulator CheY